MSDGTGIVHIAPAFGEDDANVGRKYDLPFVQFVDGRGNMTGETPYAGKFVKDADKDILVDLDKEGKLFSAPKFEHDYPFCWRCDTLAGKYSGLGRFQKPLLGDAVKYLGVRRLRASGSHRLEGRTREALRQSEGEGCGTAQAVYR